MTKEVGHVFIFLLVILISSFIHCLFKSFAHFSTWSLCLLSICKNYFYILDMNSYMVIYITYIFSYSVFYLFTLLMIYFDEHKFLILMSSSLLVFFMISIFVSYLGVFANPSSWKYFPILSFRSCEIFTFHI